MDKRFIEENHLVDLYVRGRLQGKDLDQFEIYMLEHPEILEEIEYAKGMQAAFDASGDNLLGDAGRHPLPQNVNVARRSIANASWSQWGIAALLLVSLGGNLLQWNSAEVPLVTSDGSNIRAYEVSAVRGAEAATIEIGKGQGIVRFRFLPLDQDNVTVTLQPESTSLIAQAWTLPVADRYAMLFLDPDALETGTYTLSVPIGGSVTARTLVITD